MESFLRKLGIMASCAWIIVTSPAQDIREISRIWTSADGKTVKASAVHATDAEVSLKTAAGKVFTMPLSQLSESDVEWVQANMEELQKEQQADEEPAKEKEADAVQPASPFIKKLVSGKTMSVVDGKWKRKKVKSTATYIIAYFSASWCPPCRAQASKNVKIYNERVANDPRVEVIMCNMDSSDKAIEEWAKKEKMPWPIFAEGSYEKVKALDAIAPRGIPTLILLNAEGEKIAQGSLESLLNHIPNEK